MSTLSLDGKMANNRISYNPGDVAVIHPEIPPQDVNSFLSTMGWLDIADSVYAINSSLRGESSKVDFMVFSSSTKFQIKHFPIISHPPLH